MTGSAGHHMKIAVACLTLASAVFVAGRWTAGSELTLLADQGEITSLGERFAAHERFSDEKVNEIDRKFGEIEYRLNDIQEHDLKDLSEQVDRLECMMIAIAEDRGYTHCIPRRTSLAWLIWIPLVGFLM